MDEFDIFDESSFSLLDKTQEDCEESTDIVYDPLVQSKELEFYNSTDSEASLDQVIHEFSVDDALETEIEMAPPKDEAPHDVEEAEIVENNSFPRDTAPTNDHLLEILNLPDVNPKLLSTGTSTLTPYYDSPLDHHYANETHSPQLEVPYYPSDTNEMMDYRMSIQWYIDSFEERFPRDYDYFFRTFQVPIEINAPIKPLPIAEDNQILLLESENECTYTERIMTWIRNRVVWSRAKPVFDETQLILYSAIFFIVKAEIYTAFSRRATYYADQNLLDEINRALYPCSFEAFVESFASILYHYPFNVGTTTQTGFSLLDNHILEYITPASPDVIEPIVDIKNSLPQSGYRPASLQIPELPKKANDKPSKKPRSKSKQAKTNDKPLVGQFHKRMTAAQCREQKRIMKMKLNDERPSKGPNVWKQNLRPKWKLPGGQIPMNVPPSAPKTNIKEEETSDDDSADSTVEDEESETSKSSDSESDIDLSHIADIVLKIDYVNYNRVRRKRFSMLVDRVTKMKNLDDPIPNPSKSPEPEAPVYKGSNNDQVATKTFDGDYNKLNAGFTKKLCEEIKKNISNSNNVSDLKAQKALSQASRALRRRNVRDRTCATKDKHDKVDTVGFLGSQ